MAGLIGGDLQPRGQTLDVGVALRVVKGLEGHALQPVEQPDGNVEEGMQDEDDVQDPYVRRGLEDAVEEEEEAQLDGELQPDVDEFLDQEALGGASAGDWLWVCRASYLEQVCHALRVLC